MVMLQKTRAYLHRPRGTLVFTGLLLLSSASAAQDLGGYYGGMAFNGLTANQIAITQRSIGSRLAEQTRKPVADKVVAEQTALVFLSSTIRRQANYASFVEKSRRVDPAGADGLAANLRLDPVGVAAPGLAKYGLRVDNVADAYTLWWVEAWQAVHGLKDDTPRATAQAVKAQAADALLAMPGLTSATDAQKQELAESLIVQAFLIAGSREQAGGDRAKLDAIGAAVDQGARGMGLDLRKMTLTPDGFRPAEATCG